MRTLINIVTPDRDGEVISPQALDLTADPDGMSVDNSTGTVKLVVSAVGVGGDVIPVFKLHPDIQNLVDDNVVTPKALVVPDGTIKTFGPFNKSNIYGNDDNANGIPSGKALLVNFTLTAGSGGTVYAIDNGS